MKRNILKQISSAKKSQYKKRNKQFAKSADKVNPMNSIGNTRGGIRL